MKTLTVALCLSFALTTTQLHAQQQSASPIAPDFHVPYTLTLDPTPPETFSTSAHLDSPFADAPPQYQRMPRQYPPMRPRYPRARQGSPYYAPYGSPDPSGTAEAVVGMVIATMLLVAIAH